MEMSYFEIDVPDYENMTLLYLYGYIAYIPQTKQYIISDDTKDIYIVYAVDELDALTEYVNHIIDESEYPFNKDLINDDGITFSSYPKEEFNPEKFNLTILG